ncbi:hypothetical protein SAMN04488569_101438 [Marinilactibacillus piezotolerans]|uniref:MucBP domain-containing protein n=1 Tax=Marinilactibacillus piezotolerans TaxID=258723 RepID=A0A1I3XH29_9LACT|nr:hypothetical protein [Marinilactibacillus piezotolerans]SFK18815.1 hypothetical protein SAMN04488569_101438 [Marinilactibacillus piezotolerans]
MSKYLKLIAFLSFTVVTMSVYSIMQAMAQSVEPLELITLEGDETYADDLYLAGYVNSDVNTLNPGFTYGHGKFNYVADLSFFNQLDHSLNPLVNELTNEYRSFLRGKSPYATFKESETQIVYTGTAADVYWSGELDNQLIISVLDKLTSEETSYTLSLPEDSENSSYLDVRDTYIQYPNMYFTIGSYNVATESNEFNIYAVNLEAAEPQLELIRSIDPQLNEVNGGDYEQQNLDSRYLELTSVDYETTGQPVSGELYIYDYIEDKMLNIPDLETLNSPRILSSAAGLFILNPTEQKYEAYQADTATDPVSLSKVSEISSSGSNSQLIPSFISNGLLYSYEESYTDITSQIGNYTINIQINDLNTGEVVYRGEFVSPDEQNNDVHVDYLDQFGLIE